MITTREITLDENSFFRVLLRLNFKLKTRLLYSVAAVLTVVWLILYPDQNQLYLLLVAVCLFPALIVFLTWRTAHNSMNSGVTKPRRYTITEAQIIASVKDSEPELFDITTVHRVNRTPHYYLIFTSPIEMIYLPYDAFESASDRQWFEQNVVRRARNVRGKAPSIEV